MKHRLMVVLMAVWVMSSWSAMGFVNPAPVEADLDVDSNYDHVINDSDDDPLEVTSGGRIPLNDDDDNGEQHEDRFEGTVQGEDDLVPIKLKVKPVLADGKATLSIKQNGPATDPPRIVIWEDPVKGVKSLCTWPGDQVPAVLYVEGVSNSMGNLDTQLILEYGVGLVSAADTVSVTVVQLDLDIDTDHTTDFGGPEGTLAEDQLEMPLPNDEQHPHEAHKYVLVNKYHEHESDANAIPGYADGYDLDGQFLPDNAMPRSTERPYRPVDNGPFVPVKLKVRPTDLPVAWGNVAIKFQYSMSKPTTEEVLWSFDNANGERVYRLNPAGDLRLWWDKREVLRRKASVPDGHFVPAEVNIAASDLKLPADVDLYLEGITNGYETLGMDKVRVDETGIPLSIAIDLKDWMHCTVINVDVDVDTHNRSGYAVPVRDNWDDQYEDMTNRVGKLLCVNDDDDDGDGIPDFADGYDLLSSVTGDDTNANEQFVPIVFEIPTPVDLTRAKVKLTYDASDPAGVTCPTAGTYQLPAEGSLRIWRTLGGATTRNKAAMPSGDYVAPGEYKATDFGFGTNRTLVFYVEAVKKSAIQADKRILFEVQPDERTGFMAADAVRMTAVNCDLDVDSNNDGVIDDVDDGIEEVSPGMLILANADNDDYLAEATAGNVEIDSTNGRIDGAADRADLREIRIRVPADATAAYLYKTNSGKIRVFHDDGGNGVVVLSSDAALSSDLMPYVSSSGCPVPGYAIATFAYEGVSNGTVNLELQVSYGGVNPVCSDKVEINVLEVVYVESEPTTSSSGSGSSPGAGIALTSSTSSPGASSASLTSGSSSSSSGAYQPIDSIFVAPASYLKGVRTSHEPVPVYSDDPIDFPVDPDESITCKITASDFTQQSYWFDFQGSNGRLEPRYSPMTVVQKAQGVGAGWERIEGITTFNSDGGSALRADGHQATGQVSTFVVDVDAVTSLFARVVLGNPTRAIGPMDVSFNGQLITNNVSVSSGKYAVVESEIAVNNGQFAMQIAVGHTDCWSVCALELYETVPKDASAQWNANKSTSLTLELEAKGADMNGCSVRVTVPDGVTSPQIDDPRRPGYVTSCTSWGEALAPPVISGRQLVLTVPSWTRGESIALNLANVVASSSATFEFTVETRTAGSDYTPVPTPAQLRCWPEGTPDYSDLSWDVIPSASSSGAGSSAAVASAAVASTANPSGTTPVSPTVPQPDFVQTELPYLAKFKVWVKGAASALAEVAGCKLKSDLATKPLPIDPSGLSQDVFVPHYDSLDSQTVAYMALLRLVVIEGSAGNPLSAVIYRASAYNLGEQKKELPPVRLYGRKGRAPTPSTDTLLNNYFHAGGATKQLKSPRYSMRDDDRVYIDVDYQPKADEPPPVMGNFKLRRKYTWKSGTSGTADLAPCAIVSTDTSFSPPKYLLRFEYYEPYTPGANIGGEPLTADNILGGGEHKVEGTLEFVLLKNGAEQKGIAGEAMLDTRSAYAVNFAADKETDADTIFKHFLGDSGAPATAPLPGIMDDFKRRNVNLRNYNSAGATEFTGADDVRLFDQADLAIELAHGGNLEFQLRPGSIFNWGILVKVQDMVFKNNCEWALFQSCKVFKKLDVGATAADKDAAKELMSRVMRNGLHVALGYGAYAHSRCSPAPYPAPDDFPINMHLRFKDLAKEITTPTKEFAVRWKEIMEMKKHKYPVEWDWDEVTVRPARIGCKLPDENGKNAFDNDQVSNGAGPCEMIADMAPAGKDDIKALCEEP